MDPVPGPDDPHYWERLRKGPPLDEWRAVNAPPRGSPNRRADRTVSVLIALVLIGFGALVVLPMVFGVFAMGSAAP